MDRKIIRSTGIGMMISALFIFSAGYLTDEQTPEGQNALADDEMVIKTDEYQSLQNEIVEWEEHVSALEAETEAPAEDITRMILSVESGMTSPDISSALYSNGLITDEEAFNEYLTEQNLTDQIQIGDYDLNSTMSIEQIAVLITQ
ncbi:hypothetical protein [Jeotgalibacillus haloalkalitolerans]|uniref:Endolytic transglycosylase MltG n=1 Tax=Jeotgalibacillus haloalkalitolerans TaxID=3104292 RepID=A0ABU5KM60_9BACL|nr:hypothetical protein [Jeotgalibacillus sp. HH7-29]MDZ5712168.1 hypothetical protein [Jeotgalibacillus sp. HH7-29]